VTFVVIGPCPAAGCTSRHVRDATPGPFRERYHSSPNPLNEAADHQLGVTRPFSPTRRVPGKVQLQAQVSA
jgi:hypothetical protein